MDTFRRCLFPGKIHGIFVDYVPGYDSLYYINGEIELFLGYCEFDSEQFRVLCPYHLTYRLVSV